jgi:hypothetical protein
MVRDEMKQSLGAGGLGKTEGEKSGHEWTYLAFVGSTEW